MKVFGILALVALLAAGLSGCGPANQNLEEHHLKLSDGREVLCISLTLAGSFSCDWENAK